MHQHSFNLLYLDRDRKGGGEGVIHGHTMDLMFGIVWLFCGGNNMATILVFSPE